MRLTKPLAFLTACAGLAHPADAQRTESDDDVVRVSRTTGKPSMPAGMLEAMLSPRIDAIDSLGLQPLFTRGVTRDHDPTLGNPNPWAGMIGPDDFHEGFEHNQLHGSLDDPSNWFELAGQIAPNGNVWGAAADYNGVVNNDIAMSGPNWDPDGEGFCRQGVEGGPDPLGLRSQFFASPRGTIGTQPELTGNLFVARLNHELYAPTPDEPVTIITDMYLDDITTFVWWRPVNFTAGCIVTNVFMGGFDFQYFGPFVNSDSVADRLIVLGPRPGSMSGGEFFGAPDPHRIAEREWFQVAIRMSVDSFSVWVRDSSTIGVNGFEQDSIYDGDPGDPSQGAFAGEVLASDWLQVFPGVEDDPGTGAIEGNGPAFNLFGQFPEVFLDSTGSPGGDVLFKGGVDALQMVTGSDPHQVTIPGFKPHDWYTDNYTVLGNVFTLPESPPFCIPFLDDMESWHAGMLGFQNNEWFSPSNATIGVDQNNTPGGSISARHELVAPDSLMRETFNRDLPLADAAIGDPVEASVFVRQSGPRATRAIFADDNTRTNDYAFRILLGARDASGVVDDRVYARMPNPNFDPAQRAAVGPSAADQHVAGTNTRFVNAPLVDGSGAPITTPLDQWYEVRAVMAPPYDAPGSLRIFIDGVEAFADGSVEGVTDLTAPSSVFDELEFWCGFEKNAVGNVFWVDDISVLGPELLRPTPQTVVEAPYTAQPPFSLPYTDDFSAYEAGRPLGGQGATAWLAGLFVDTNAELDIISLAPGENVDTSTLGYYYTIDSLVDGALPTGMNIGDTVFVVDNIAPALPPKPDPVPGASDGDATPMNLRDVECRPFARGEWILLDNDAEPFTPIVASPWDGATPVIGRYWHTFITRWTSTAGEERLVADPSNFPSNGPLVSLISSFVSGDADTGDLDGQFTAHLPEARPDPGATARLSFDLWIGMDDPASGPRGRLAWTIEGPGAQAGEIATVVFGGPNNFLDENTFDPGDGSVSPGSDGQPDNYFEGGPASLGGPPTYADPTLLYQQVPNPAGGVGGAPDFLLEQTAYSVPGNTWIRCVAEIESDGAWTITLDDGATAPFVLGGEALEGINGTHGGDVQGTDGLFLQNGHDAGASGEPVEGPITWTGLGAAAAPEGGSAPLVNDASIQGSYNEVDTPAYFYFEVFEVNVGATDLPTVTEIDPASGAIHGPRDLQQGDVVALWNNQQTSAFGGGAAPFLERIATNGDYFISNDGGATINARGTWIPLGLPGLDGFNDPAPLGGIVNSAPPYNATLPFPTIVMGSIVDFPAFGPAHPPARWFVDNVALEIVGCLGDLTGDSTVDGADLGILLGAWGSADASADLNADGVVDGADLGLQLGAWGACP